MDNFNHELSNLISNQSRLVLSAFFCCRTIEQQHTLTFLFQIIYLVASGVQQKLTCTVIYITQQDNSCIVWSNIAQQLNNKKNTYHLIVFPKCQCNLISKNIKHIQIQKKTLKKLKYTCSEQDFPETILLKCPLCLICWFYLSNQWFFSLILPNLFSDTPH